MSASEMTMQAKLEYVKKAGVCSVHALPLDKTPWWGYALNHHRLDWEFDTEEEVVDATFAFTIERERQIAVMECRLLFMQDVKQDAVASDYALCDGIIEMIQTSLQEMRRGMRKEGE